MYNMLNNKPNLSTYSQTVDKTSLSFAEGFHDAMMELTNPPETKVLELNQIDVVATRHNMVHTIYNLPDVAPWQPIKMIQTTFDPTMYTKIQRVLYK